MASHAPVGPILASPLLQLPRELRDKILNCLIASHTQPPISGSNPENRSGLEKGYRIMHVKSLNRAELIPTLLVNHQLHDETMTAIGLFPNNYVMQAILVNEEQLWPTWVSVPKLTSRIDRLHFSLQSVGLRVRKRCTWRGGCGGPPLITWIFYKLLDQVLKTGPLLGSSKDYEISIRNLDIEVLPPDVPRDKISPISKYPPEDEWDTGYVTNPRMLLEFLWVYLQALLGMSYHTAQYGAFLFERLGKIRMILDGEILHEVDLAERLRDCHFRESFGDIPREDRQSYFEKWKSNAYAKRVELELPVLMDQTSQEI